MVGLDARRGRRRLTEGQGRGAPSAGSATGWRSAAATAPRVLEVTRDMAEAYALGVSEAFPEAAQTVDRFHVM
jgi:transposase